MKIASVAVPINLVDSVMKFWQEFVRELMAVILDTISMFKVLAVSRTKKKPLHRGIDEEENDRRF